MCGRIHVHPSYVHVSPNPLVAGSDHSHPSVSSSVFTVVRRRTREVIRTTRRRARFVPLTASPVVLRVGRASSTSGDLPDLNPSRPSLPLTCVRGSDGRDEIRTTSENLLAQRAEPRSTSNPARSVFGFADAQFDSGRDGIRTRDQKVRNLLPSPLGHTPAVEKPISWIPFRSRSPPRPPPRR